MICGDFTLDNVPDGKQDEVEHGFKTNVPPPTSTKKSQNANRTWKVTASWPPCPSGSTSVHDPANAAAKTRKGAKGR